MPSFFNYNVGYNVGDEITFNRKGDENTFNEKLKIMDNSSNLIKYLDKKYTYVIVEKDKNTLLCLNKNIYDLFETYTRYNKIQVDFFRYNLIDIAKMIFDNYNGLFLNFLKDNVTEDSITAKSIKPYIRIPIPTIISHSLQGITSTESEEYIHNYKDVFELKHIFELKDTNNNTKKKWEITQRTSNIPNPFIQQPVVASPASIPSQQPPSQPDNSQSISLPSIPTSGGYYQDEDDEDDDDNSTPRLEKGDLKLSRNQLDEKYPSLKNIDMLIENTREYYEKIEEKEKDQNDDDEEDDEDDIEIPKNIYDDYNEQRLMALINLYSKDEIFEDYIANRDYDNINTLHLVDYPSQLIVNAPTDKPERMMKGYDLANIKTTYDEIVTLHTKLDEIKNKMKNKNKPPLEQKQKDALIKQTDEIKEKLEDLIDTYNSYKKVLDKLSSYEDNIKSFNEEVQLLKELFHNDKIKLLIKGINFHMIKHYITEKQENTGGIKRTTKKIYKNRHQSNKTIKKRIQTKKNNIKKRIQSKKTIKKFNKKFRKNNK
jgi:hypothetical protein